MISGIIRSAELAANHPGQLAARESAKIELKEIIHDMIGHIVIDVVEFGAVLDDGFLYVATSYRTPDSERPKSIAIQTPLELNWELVV